MISLSLRYAMNLVWITATALAAGNSLAQTTSDQLEETEREIRVHEHRNSLELRAINPATIRSWGSKLDLDADQLEMLNNLAEEYLQKIRVLGKTKSKIELFWTSAFKYDREKHEVVQVVNPQLLELYEKYFQLLKKIMQADQSLFDSLRTSLETEAALELRQIQYQRLRSILKTPYDTKEDSLDLAAMIKSLNFSEEVMNQINPDLELYYREIIELLTNRNFYTSHYGEWERARFFYSLGPGWEYGISEKEQAEYEETWNEIITNRPLENSTITIGTINWNYLERIARKFSKPDRIKLRAEFHSRIMPELFMEESAVLKIAEKTRNTIGNTLEIRERIDSKTENMMKRLDPLSRQFLIEQLQAKQPIFPLLVHTHLDDAINMLLTEIDRLEIQLDRRDLMAALIKSLITISLTTDNANTSTTKSLNNVIDMMEEQDDADIFRIAGLHARLDVLQKRYEQETRDK